MKDEESRDQQAQLWHAISSPEACQARESVMLETVNEVAGWLARWSAKAVALPAELLGESE